MQQERANSILTIEGQNKISLSGVNSVEGFSETEINLTVTGKKLRICGSKLKVLAFSQGSGNFSAIGEIISLKYGAEKGRFFRRLFK